MYFRFNISFKIQDLTLQQITYYFKTPYNTSKPYQEISGAEHQVKLLYYESHHFDKRNLIRAIRKSITVMAKRIWTPHLRALRCYYT